MTNQSLKLNLKFTNYTIPETANIIYWLVCFSTGFLISYFASLIFRFKAQKRIKLQSQTITNYRDTVQDLKKEIEKIKASGYFESKKQETSEIENNENPIPEV